MPNNPLLTERSSCPPLGLLFQPPLFFFVCLFPAMPSRKVYFLLLRFPIFSLLEAAASGLARLERVGPPDPLRSGARRGPPDLGNPPRGHRPTPRPHSPPAGASNPSGRGERATLQAMGAHGRAETRCPARPQPQNAALPPHHRPPIPYPSMLFFFSPLPSPALLSANGRRVNCWFYSH